MIELTQASPWLQLPIVLVFALPIAVLVAVVILRLVDGLAAVLNGDVE